MERKKEQSNTEFFKKSVVREPKLYKKMESRRDFKRLPIYKDGVTQRL